MLILLLGDCHGRLDLVHNACVEAQAAYGIEAAIQVGDFGFYPEILHRFLHEGPRRFPVPLHVIDGNHEDHGWLTKCRADGTLDTWEEANLHVHARGSIDKVGGLNIGFIGGALHADRRQEWSGQRKSPANDDKPNTRRRVPRDPTWANWVTEGDVERTLKTFAITTPDLIVSHSCPASIGIGMIGAIQLIENAHLFITRSGHRSGPFHDCGEGGLTTIWNRLIRHPPLWIFGHFHCMYDKVVAETRFVCVGSSDGSDGAKGRRSIMLNTNTRELTLR